MHIYGPPGSSRSIDILLPCLLYLFFDSLPAQVTPPSRKDSDRRDETDVERTERDAGACVISVHSPGYFTHRPPADEAPSSSQALREPLPIRSSRTVQG